MRKTIFLTIFALLGLTLIFAQTSTPTSTPTSTATTTQTSTPPKGKKEVDLACLRSAVEKRENALKTARENYFNKINQAYEERKNALLEAWSMSDVKSAQRAVRDAWMNFRKAVRNAWQEYKKAHKNAWNEFVKDRKNCGSGPTGENPGIDLNI